MGVAAYVDIDLDDFKLEFGDFEYKNTTVSTEVGGGVQTTLALTFDSPATMDGRGTSLQVMVNFPGVSAELGIGVSIDKTGKPTGTGSIWWSGDRGAQIGPPIGLKLGDSVSVHHKRFELSLPKLLGISPSDSN